jgi:nicotinate-nucleotide adenylyltransferase
MRRIGIYGSSFDPITYSHMFTASAVASRKRLDKVFFTPCSSKRRDKILQTDDYHRLKMLELALDTCKNKTNRFGEPLFEISQVEMNALAGETYTYDTMDISENNSLTMRFSSSWVQTCLKDCLVGEMLKNW